MPSSRLSVFASNSDFLHKSFETSLLASGVSFFYPIVQCDMENSQLIEALRLCPLFKGFSNQEMAELLSQIHYKLVDYSPKDIYVLAGMPCRHADIVVSGQMTARMVGLSGKFVEVDHRGPGSLMAPALIFVPDSEMPVSVETEEPTRIFRMTPAELKRLIDSNERIRTNFILVLSQINYFLTQKMRVLALFSVREKVVSLLKQIARKQQSEVITLTRSRQQIADSFGIQKFSLLRVLATLEEEGAIRVEGKTIRIVDRSKL